jgi:hypothetical protein
MYPSRFFREGKKANGTLLRAVENEFYRLKHAHLHDSKWWDNTLRRRVTVDTNVFSTISVVEEGRGSSPKVFEITWGDKIFEGIQAGYTKGISDTRTEKIPHGIELRVYRYLDRQLSLKSQQVVGSCQKWAKEDILMRNYKVMRGGRTASTYILNEVSKVLKSLAKLDFNVKLTSISSKSDFTFIFDRLDGPVEKEKTVDHAAELVWFFQKTFQNIKTKGSIYAKDRVISESWLDIYGFEKSQNLVKLACKRQKKERPDNPPKFFRGLSLYEAEVLKEYESLEKKMDTKKKSLAKEDLELKWRNFLNSKIEDYVVHLNEEERGHLKIQSEKRAKELEPYAWTIGRECLEKAAIKRSKRAIIQERLGINRGMFEQSQL